MLAIASLKKDIDSFVHVVLDLFLFYVIIISEVVQVLDISADYEDVPVSGILNL